MALTASFRTGAQAQRSRRSTGAISSQDHERPDTPGDVARIPRREPRADEIGADDAAEAGTDAPAAVELTDEARLDLADGENRRRRLVNVQVMSRLADDFNPPEERVALADRHGRLGQDRVRDEEDLCTGNDFVSA